MDHGLDLGARFVISRHERCALCHKGILPALQGLVLLALLAALLEQFLVVRFEAFEVFTGLFQSVHESNIVCPVPGGQ
jgi:hypothetical protein